MPSETSQTVNPSKSTQNVWHPYSAITIKGGRPKKKREREERDDAYNPIYLLRLAIVSVYKFVIFRQKWSWKLNSEKSNGMNKQKIKNQDDKWLTFNARSYLHTEVGVRSKQPGCHSGHVSWIQRLPPKLENFIILYRLSYISMFEFESFLFYNNLPKEEFQIFKLRSLYICTYVYNLFAFFLFITLYAMYDFF